MNPCNGPACSTDVTKQAWYAKELARERKVQQYVKLVHSEPEIFKVLDGRLDCALNDPDGEKVKIELTLADAQKIIGAGCDPKSSMAALLKAAQAWAKCLEERGFTTTVTARCEEKENCDPCKKKTVTPKIEIVADYSNAQEPDLDMEFPDCDEVTRPEIQ
jgi:hypothetical protein